jgi:magnesium transporter
MISRYSYSGLTWVDLENPTQEEVAHVLSEFDLPALVGEEMLTNTLRSKVDLYDNFMYVILHFPTGAGEEFAKSGEQEVDFVLGKNFILTVRYELIDPIHQFAKLFEKNSFGTSEKMMNHSGYIFMEMMKQFYRNSLKELETIGLAIRDIEYRIFEGQEESMVKEISRTSRRLLDFKQAIRFHQDVLRSYESVSARLFGDDYVYYASLISSEYNKVSSLLESHRDTLSELQRTNDSLLTTRSNEIMRTFTIMTFVMIPLTIITGVFGMNTDSDLVFIKTISDFFFVIGAMVLTAFIMFLFFRFRKWL